MKPKIKTSLSISKTDACNISLYSLNSRKSFVLEVDYSMKIIKTIHAMDGTKSIQTLVQMNNISENLLCYLINDLKTNDCISINELAIRQNFFFC